VIAMTVRGQFADLQEIKTLNSSNSQSAERLVVLSMDLVHYMTKVSGFLNINSTEQKRYMNFDPASFRTPNVDWTPPHPYCPDNVLFPLEQREIEYQILAGLPRPPLVFALQEEVLWQQLLADENLGG
jgi:hypothetical protein